MVHEEIPKDVLHFLDTCIDSVEQLWVLLLLHSQPDRDWSTAELTSELRSADSSISKRLNDLYHRKVLIRHPEHRDKHRFLLSEPELEPVIRELAEQNQLRPYRLIEAIYSRPAKVLMTFAEAFKIRGEKS